MNLAKHLCALILLALVACGGHESGNGNGNGSDAGIHIDGLQSIRIDPANQTLTIDGTTAATQTYKAIGTFDDGHEEDITGLVGWSLVDTTLGGFVGADFTSDTQHGGRTMVQANGGDVQGFTGLTLVMHQRVGDPGSTGLPSDPGGLFGGTADPNRAPDLVYPNDGVLVPPNLGLLEFHFIPGNGNDLFELSFKNDITDVAVYLKCMQPLNGGCIYQPDATVWHWLAETNRGDSVQVKLRATAAAGGAGVGSSAELSLSFSHDDIQGGLYYWTTSNGTGIMRFDFASTTQTQAEKFLGTQLTGGTCVGCHALAHDGSKLVAEAGGQNDGRTLLLDIATLMPMVPFGSTPKSTFESWNPDGSQYVGVYGDNGATDFDLLLFDGNSGAQLGTIPGTGDATHPADHPDWSPDGMNIAFVRVGKPTTLQKMHEGAIEMVSNMGGTWSSPVELVAHADGKNHYYPTFSPDGSFLVFDESTCSSGGSECNADVDPTATLFAVKASAGASPILLAKANAPGKMDHGNTSLTNTFPKWSPFVFQRTGEQGSRLEWVTFSSVRQYGLRHPPAGEQGNPESPTGLLVWMAAIDPDAVAAGQDGSFAAFALPFQDLNTSNHIAQWTTKVVPGVE